MFGKLVKLMWYFINGEVAHAWVWRIAIIAVGALDAIIIYRMLPGVVSGDKWINFLLKALFSISFLLVLFGYRGFEVRPEFMANSMVLVGGWLLKYLVTCDGGSSPRTTLLSCVGVLLVASAGALSMRHFLPSMVLLATTVVVFGLRAGSVGRVIAFGCWVVLCVVILHVLEFNIFERIQEARAFQADRMVRSISERLTVGGYRFHRLRLLLFLVGWAFFLTMLVVAWTKRTIDGRTVTANVGWFFSFVAFVFFLFLYDARPFEYVRSIEAVFLFVAYILAVNSRSLPKGNLFVSRAANLMMVCPLIAMAYESAGVVSWPTGDVVRELVASVDKKSVAALKDVELLHLMLDRKSIVTQVRARQEVCRRFQGHPVAVSDWRDHPICLRDKGERISMENNDLRSESFSPRGYLMISLRDDRDLREFGFWRLNLGKTRRVWINGALISPG